jgi:hypothetical protein
MSILKNLPKREDSQSPSMIISGARGHGKQSDETAKRIFAEMRSD